MSALRTNLGPSDATAAGPVTAGPVTAWTGLAIIPSPFGEDNLLYRTRDPDIACTRTGQVFRNHRMRMAGGDGSVAARMHHIRTGHFSLNLLGYGAEVEIFAEGMNDFFLIELPLSGTARLRLGAEEMVARPGHCSVISPQPSLRKRWAAGCEQLIVRYEREALEQTLSRLIGRRLTEPLRFRMDMPADGAAGRHWLNALRYVAECLIAMPDARQQPLMIGLLEQSLALALLLNQPHNYSVALSDGAGRAVPGFMPRVEAHIADHLHEVLTLAGLADIAGVSARTLQTAFHTVHGRSVMQHVRERRLNAARTELLRGAAQRSVTDIALACGFAHLGRFSQSYRSRFGEHPSRTRAAA